jgi:hypothetical protein
VDGSDTPTDVGVMHPIERTYLPMGTWAQRRPRRRGIAATLPTVLITTCLGVFLAQLDTSVVNLALKHIGAELGSSVTQLQWVLDGYNLAYAAFLLTGGTLGDIFGRRRLFMVGVALFQRGIVDLRDRSRQCDLDHRQDADRAWRRVRDADIARNLVRCLS